MSVRSTETENKYLSFFIASRLLRFDIMVFSPSPSASVDPTLAKLLASARLSDSPPADASSGDTGGLASTFGAVSGEGKSPMSFLSSLDAAAEGGEGA